MNQKELIKIIMDARKASLQELYLGGNQLTSLPAEIGLLTNLKELYLGGNPKLEIQDEIKEKFNL